MVMAVVALLVALLLPSLRAARDQARSVQCASNLRSIAMKFQLFADGTHALGRGHSERLGPGRFYINDFQDALYGIDEFWDAGQRTSATLEAGKSASLCPAGARRLVKQQGYPCGRKALQPAEDVSLAFNMRLYRGQLQIGGQTVLAPVALSMVRADVLNHPYVPLLLDGDGKAAAARGNDPFYIAPALADRKDPYAGDRYWTPAARHGRRTNVAFVGGHVLASGRPEGEHWNWEYTATVGR